jgi:hypothetical protein
MLWYRCKALSGPREVKNHVVEMDKMYDGAQALSILLNKGHLFGRGGGKGKPFGQIQSLPLGIRVIEPARLTILHTFPTLGPAPNS